MNAWPYPFWIAHRGSGKLAPENTLAAFRLGGQYGYRMFECDAKLSADNIVFLMHDDTLDRTTNSSGLAGQLPWSMLAQLDAGSWHSRHYSGEPPCSLLAVAHFCISNGYSLNIEIKPSPGTDFITGEVVAHQALSLWENQPIPPLLSSFKPQALLGAMSSAPTIPRCLLLESYWHGWLQAATELDCSAVIAHFSMWDTESVSAVHAAGMKALSYTVNHLNAVQTLKTLSIDGIITDRLDLFSPT